MSFVLLMTQSRTSKVSDFPVILSLINSCIFLKARRVSYISNNLSNHSALDPDNLIKYYSQVLAIINISEKMILPKDESAEEDNCYSIKIKTPSSTSKDSQASNITLGAIEVQEQSVMGLVFSRSNYLDYDLGRKIGSYQGGNLLATITHKLVQETPVLQLPCHFPSGS